jgi:acetyltransferase-like isoleucine patch superfamily enzyme
MKRNNNVVETKSIGKNVRIAEYCIIRHDVKIGNNVIIHPHVTICEGTEIGDNVEIFSGALIGKEPKAPGLLLREIKYTRKIYIGESTSIGPNCIIYYDVEIGDCCLIGDAVAIRENCRIGNRCVLGRHVSLNYNVTVGERTKIMANSHITGNSRIGKYVFIGVGVISANDNNFGTQGYTEKTIQGPTIGDYVKIGVGAILLPNITISDNALIYAGSVVTKDVEKNSVIMGIPAIHIKFQKEIKDC